MITSAHIKTLLEPSKFAGSILACYKDRDPFEIEPQPEPEKISLAEASRILGIDRHVVGKLAKNQQFSTLDSTGPYALVDRSEVVGKIGLGFYGAFFIRPGFELIGEAAKRNGCDKQSLIRYAKSNPDRQDVDFVYHCGVLCYAKSYVYKRAYTRGLGATHSGVLT